MQQELFWRNSIIDYKFSSLSVDDYVNGIQSGRRSILARAITLMESRVAAHREIADLVLQRIMKSTGKSKRVGITGVPGVGKSTFIEALGSKLCEGGHHVAVLTVDPTSSLSGGSILGDKTRMEQLSRHENAFIRPSAAGETLGGVARKTREAMLLCEAAGFDVVLVETVGVGQSEITVRSMVDFFLLMLLPGGGDELQGIKKGVVELADSLFVNKADGPNRDLAELSKREYSSAVHGIRPSTRGWHSNVYTGSAKTCEGLDEMWKVIERFFVDMEGQGFIVQRRREQAQAWLRDMLKEELVSRFFQDKHMQQRLQEIDEVLLNNAFTVPQAAKNLLEEYEKGRTCHD